MINQLNNNLVTFIFNPVWNGNFQKSLPYSLLSPYSISRIPFWFKMKKASKHLILKLFLWAQMDLNHRPSDYESDALTNWAMGPKFLNALS